MGAQIELTIIMPCLDEAETVQTCVTTARGYLESRGIDGEVLVADNGSTDGSQQLAADAGARVIDVPTRGYGAALIAGIQAARGRYFVMGDADDSYDFAALDPFLEELRNGADLVMGNRFAGGIEPGAMPPLHRYLGNPVLSFVGRRLFRSDIGDFHCGLRAMNTASAAALCLQSPGMEFASEMVVKATLNELRIVEVPTVLRRDGRSRPPHLRSWRDGWRHLRFLLLFSPRWLFLYPGALLLVLGLSVGARLTFGPWDVGPLVLDVHTLVACSGIALIGYQGIWFGVLSKAFASREGLLPNDVRVERFRSRFPLERAILASVLAALAGVAGLAVALAKWGDTGFGPLESGRVMRIVVPSTFVLVAAAQTLLSSLLLSVLALPSGRPAMESWADRRSSSESASDHPSPERTP